MRRLRRKVAEPIVLLAVGDAVDGVPAEKRLRLVYEVAAVENPQLHHCYTK